MWWDGLAPMERRHRFVLDLESLSWRMSDLCRHHGVSRKTGYEWAARWSAGGLEGLAPRSRAPVTSPHRTPSEVLKKLAGLRETHPSWGARKLLCLLGRLEPELELPAASTVGAYLKREGWIEPRRRRAPAGVRSPPRAVASAPNDVWACDFKGQFLLGDARYCYPLTLTDSFSRYLLACHGLSSTGSAGARAVFERAFRQFGLPRVMLSDNGIPFASHALGGLSRLSVWWIQLGIEPVRIEPGKPQQNGRHERFHRTLKAATARPPAPQARAQQRLFDQFGVEYNEVRPHEALEMKTPAELYQPSDRPYPRKLPPIEYPGHYEVRRVKSSGEIRWKGQCHFLSEVLAGQPVGLVEVDDGIWALYFAQQLLSQFDERCGNLRG